MAQQRNTPPRRPQATGADRSGNTTRPAATRSSSTPKSGGSWFPKGSGTLLFGRTNFMYMLLGVGLISIGLILMSGGKQVDANTWDPNVIYSTRITVIAPIFILAGLIVEFWAIFKKDTSLATSDDKNTEVA